MILAISQKLISAALIVVSSIAIGLGVIIGVHVILIVSITALNLMHH